MTTIFPAYKSMRLNGFDYSKNAIYFTTICCTDRIHHFGRVADGKVFLNECGTIVKKQIEWLGQQYPYCVIHNFIVMPNHVHILLEINSKKIENSNVVKNYLGNKIIHSDCESIVGDGRDHHPQNKQSIQQKKIKSLSELMGAFKTTSSKQIHLNGNINFSWQKSFHDHIVRSQERYVAIDNYIDENPKRWKEDKFRN